MISQECSSRCSTGERLPFFWRPLAARTTCFQLLDDWSDDAFDFLRSKGPRILGILIVAFILTRLLRVLSQRVGDLSNREGFPSGVHAQQLRTLSSVIYSVGVFIIMFLATMQILSQVNVNVGPLLASAGIAGVAIGFGAQTVVKDFINGFFILVENQFDIGDTVKIAGVQGKVEAMTLRRTLLRGDDGALYTVPSCQITIVSNMTRDWAQLPNARFDSLWRQQRPGDSAIERGSSGSYARSAVCRSDCRPAPSRRNREGHLQRGRLPHAGENQAGCAVHGKSGTAPKDQGLLREERHRAR